MTYKADTAIVGFVSDVEETDVEITFAHCIEGAVPQDNRKLESIKKQLLSVCRFWWLNTLCINKADMAELDMSIESMHNWYSAASIVCVPVKQDVKVWTTREWCLQEGKAARAILLDTSQFPRGGDTMRNTLLEMGCITNEMPASLWLFLMQKRKTTRVEDKAYALIGLLKFDFQILSGEGQRS